MITTFSGAHPFRPQCVTASFRATFTEWANGEGYDTQADAMVQLIEDMGIAETTRVTKAVDLGICPRCSDPLLPGPVSTDWKPAGSRATDCRCIPICERCASWAEPCLGVLSVTGWPVDQMETEDGTTRKEQEIAYANEAEAAYPPIAMTVTSTPAGRGLVADDGTAFVPQLRPHPGGWLEHGFDDAQDQQERES